MSAELYVAGPCAFHPMSAVLRVEVRLKYYYATAPIMLTSRISAMRLLKDDWVLRSIYHPDIRTARLYLEPALRERGLIW